MSLVKPLMIDTIDRAEPKKGQMKDILKPGQVIDGRYKVVRHFLDGSFGPLYIVENLRVPMQSILKVNLPYEELEIDKCVHSSNLDLIASHNHLERTQNELMVTTRLNHQNIIKIVDSVDIHEKYKGIITEKLENVRPLSDYFRYWKLDEDVRNLYWPFPEIKVCGIHRVFDPSFVNKVKNEFKLANLEEIVSRDDLLKRLAGPVEFSYMQLGAYGFPDIIRWDKGKTILCSFNLVRHIVDSYLSLFYADYVRQIQAAIEYVNKKGYLHKDIKPENILVENDTTVKIIDFGIAGRISEPGQMFGNRIYRPPECFTGRQHRNSDMWSVGVLCNELLTGEYVFRKKDKEHVHKWTKRLLLFSKTTGFYDERIPFEFSEHSEPNELAAKLEACGLNIASWMKQPSFLFNDFVRYQMNMGRENIQNAGILEHFNYCRGVFLQKRLLESLHPNPKHRMFAPVA